MQRFFRDFIAYYANHSGPQPLISSDRRISPLSFSFPLCKKQEFEQRERNSFLLKHHFAATIFFFRVTRRRSSARVSIHVIMYLRYTIIALLLFNRRCCCYSGHCLEFLEKRDNVVLGPFCKTTCTWSPYSSQTAPGHNQGNARIHRTSVPRSK